MRCERCGKDFKVGVSNCPQCGAEVHYWGKTTVFRGVTQSTLTIGDLFSGTFESHSKNAADRMFIAGTPLTTPAPGEMLHQWEKPWLYFRMLLVGLLFILLSYFFYKELHHPGGLFLMSILGSLVFPLAVLIFFWEINIPRDIPLYRVLFVFFIGGLLSLIFTLLLPKTGGPAYLAPLTEEPGKIIALAIFVSQLKSRRILSGMLIGAAVGAGFAAFEDIWYVMKEIMIYAVADVLDFVNTYMQEYGVKFFTDLHQSMLMYFKNPDAKAAELFSKFMGMLYNTMRIQESGSHNFIGRSICTVGGHVTWAAIEGGALVMVKRSEKLQVKHFIDIRFLGYVAVAMLLHFLWNCDFELYPLPIFDDLKYLILMIAAVFVAFTLIKKGIAQVLDEVNNAPQISSTYVNSNKEFAEAVSAASVATSAILMAIAGPLQGSSFPFKKSVTIGRDPKQCNIVFPSQTPGVSRCHCKLELRNDGVYIMDVGSSNGTFFQNGQRLPVNQWVKVTQTFYLGSSKIVFSVK